MQATPQQLNGGSLYSKSVLIGNWYEERTLQEAKLSDFRSKAASGSSQLRKMQTKLTKCLMPVPHSYSSDGLIRYGDSIMIGHINSSNVLACDPFQDNFPGSGRYQVSGTSLLDPVARNIFKIVRPPSHLKNNTDDETDPVLRVGQAFLLACNDSLLISPEAQFMEPTLFLGSMKKNERMSTKTSNRQLVFMSAAQNQDAIWVTMPPSRGKIGSSDRFLSIGNPLSVDDVVLFIHRQTNTYLTADPANVEKTEFGNEIECYTDRSSEFGKISLIQSEFKGTCTAETLSKPDAPKYFWQILMSQDERTAVDERSLPPLASMDVLLDEIRLVSTSKGPEGLSALRVMLIIVDKKSRVNDAKIDREDVKECLMRWGFRLGDKYADSLLDAVDNGSGLLNYKDFLDFIRGPVEPSRIELLESIFSQLDSIGEGQVPVVEMMKAFRPESHPLVASGFCSEREMRSYLLDSITMRGKTPAHFSKAAFVDFFSDLEHASDSAYFQETLQILFPL